MRAKTKKAKACYIQGSLVIEPPCMEQDEYVQYQNQHGHSGLTTECVGLVISTETPYIGASPDARVHDPTYSPPHGLAEYKNPYSSRQLSIDEACQSKTFFLQKEEKDGKITYSLKRRHDYYYQVQCQLYCEGREWCDFVVRTEKGIFIERISQDNKWWKEQIPKIKEFYFKALLPELACPRYRQGGIREPNTQTQ